MLNEVVKLFLLHLKIGSSLSISAIITAVILDLLQYSTSAELQVSDYCIVVWTLVYEPLMP
jgi:hypothetical protein